MNQKSFDMKYLLEERIKDRMFISAKSLKLFLLFIFLTLGPVFSSCMKEPFYVKYEIDSSTIYFGGELTVMIKDESNETKSYTVNQRERWEIIIGPVGSGFTANLKAQAIGETHDKLKLYPSIYLSLNDGPFTLEATDQSDELRDEVEISHKIE